MYDDGPPEMATTTKETLDAIAEQVDAVRTELHGELTRVEDHIRQAVQERPLAALIAAVAGGFLLARLVRR